jgi:hypothetical protein
MQIYVKNYNLQTLFFKNLQNNVCELKFLNLDFI